MQIETSNPEHKLPAGACNWRPGIDPPVGGPMWKRNEDVRDAWSNLLAQDWESVTVINLLPFDVNQRVSSVGEVSVKKCPFGTPYTRTVIDNPRMDMKEMGNGMWSPTPILPVQLAKELVAKYQAQGGVFYFLGTGEVPKDLLARAMEQRDQWFHAQYAKGCSEWAQFRDITKIQPNYKVAAQYLYESRAISDLPEWVVTTKDEQLKHRNECEQCGELNVKQAKVCKECSYPIDREWVIVNRPKLAEEYGLVARQTAAEASAPQSGADAKPPKPPKFGKE